MTPQHHPFALLALVACISMATPSGADDKGEPPKLERRGILSHVSAGQRYIYTVRLAKTDYELIFEVLEISERSVKYTSTTYQAGRTVGKPTTETWTAAEAGDRPKDGPEAKPPVGETLELAGVSWNCRIVEADGIRTWYPTKEGQPTFPPHVKQMKGERVIIELKRITELGAGDQDLGPAPNGLDVRHCRPGQKYTYFLQNNMQMIYEVTRVTKTEIKYTTQTIMNGKAIGDPTPVSVPLKTVAVDPKAKAQGPQPVGTETITIDGIAYPCKIYDFSGSKSWTSMKFPFTVRVQSGDKVVMELTKIEGARR